MNNARPATVIILGGLRVGLPPLCRRAIPLHRPRVSPHTSASIPCRRQSTAPPATRPSGYTEIAQPPRRPTTQGRPKKNPPAGRLLKGPEDEGSAQEKINSITAHASTGRLYELLRIEASIGDFQKVEGYAECLMSKHKEAPNMRIYSALILANVNPLGSIASVTDYIRQLRADGFDLDNIACHDILKVLAVHPDYLLRSEILEYMQEKWLQLNEAGRHDLVAGYLRDNSFEMALDEVDHMKGEGITIRAWLYDMLIYALCKRGEFDEVLRVLEGRIADGDDNISTLLWNYLLDTSSAACHYELSTYVWKKRVQTSYISPPLGVHLNVLTAAARQGDTRLATDVFAKLSSRSIVFEPIHYELLVEAYVNAGDIDTALSVMCVMQESKLIPTARMTRSLLKYMGKDEDKLNEVFESLRSMAHYGKGVPTAALNVVIEGAIYQSNLEKAVEFYKTLHEICPSGANIDTFNELLRGCHYSKRKDLALLLASELLALGLKPDQLTYDRMLLVCTQEDDYEDALLYYREMRIMRVDPRNGTLLLLVKTMVKKGDGRVFAVVNDMEGRGGDIRANVNRIKIWIQRNWVGDKEVMERGLWGED